MCFNDMQIAGASEEENPWAQVAKRKCASAERASRLGGRGVDKLRQHPEGVRFFGVLLVANAEALILFLFYCLAVHLIHLERRK